ncbi:hypothetical protein GCM10022255_045050 [Dactylosporangium darangshiense]|uniref:Uncharacterized protein n=1 Tax=Dactylosporangium darangshiense TaxID=579108 RepID=A0ABP8DB21_9ACTN
MSTSLRPLAGTACMTMAVVALSALAGCSSGSRPAVDSAHATTTVTTPRASGAPAVPATPTGTEATAHPSGTATLPTRSTADPCPVTVATLLSALRDSPDFYHGEARPAALRDVACASGYATAGTVYDEAPQPSQIVFGFDAANSHWRPLNVGSGDICEGFVPSDVARKLPACG